MRGTEASVPVTSNSLRRFEGLIDCRLHLARRNRTLDQLAANPETRRCSYAAAFRALLITGHQCCDRWRAETRTIPGLVDPDRLGQRIERRSRIWQHFPTRLRREQCVVHLPELVLRASAHRRDRSLVRVRVDRQREVDVRHAYLAGLHVVVAYHLICGVVPFLAVRALEVAHLDHPDLGRWRSLDA